jgi:hypothetical protein
MSAFLPNPASAALVQASPFGESTNALARELNVAALGINMTV